MSFLELFIIAVGLSADAFAVALCTGIKLPKSSFKNMLVVGLYFGIFQAAMPVIGYLAGSRFADKITGFDHWIAFALLIFIGGKMVIELFKKEPKGKEATGGETGLDESCAAPEKAIKEKSPLSPVKMLPLAVATSIDALAVGVTFAFLDVSIVPAVSFIGAVTLILSMAGVKIGNKFGAKFKTKAEFAGGVILILMGVKILFGHLGFISF